MKRTKGILFLAVVILLGVASVSRAPGAEKPFYEGKTVTIIVGFATGTGYDLYGRLLARHIGKHIPGTPKVFVENIEGGGGLMGLNHLYYRLKPDGLALHIIAPLAILRQLLGDPSVRPDVRKLTWVGTASHESTVCFVRHDGRYQRFEDMIGAKESLIVGATPGGTREYYPKLLKEVLGANLKIVTGYKSAGPFYAALESGEVEAACGFGWNVLKGERPHWIKEKIMRVFLQLNPAEKDSELPDVPWVMDYVKTPAQRQLIQAGMGTQIINRTFVAAPGIPADRARILRRAFMDTMKDPEFLADAARTKIDINPRTNSEIETLIKEWFSLPLESVEKLRKIFFPAGF